ncbi:Y-family DNA polymerase [Baekduia sp. Peel2402]|uniref:Y-family DNA polymerase n=1 Tax=Baekduia sp. Peel2402 TaxID=3458296 RepID=UPI00403EE8B5
MVVAVLLSRFELVIAAGGRAALAQGPAALAPEPGREQCVGEVSSSAEAFGVHKGMRLGEALARCPSLALIPPDPVGVADAWEKVIARLESVGAAVESDAPGLAFFDAASLARLHGGTLPPAQADGNVVPFPGRAGGAPPWLAGVVSAVRAALRLPARIGAGPSRFCALAGAVKARSRRAEVVDGARGLASEPVALLRRRPEAAQVVEPLIRLGVTTLGQLATMSRASIADRFGRVGELAHDLARGRDTELRPRVPGEVLEEMLELPESASGVQLERALVLLVDQLLARRERRGRTLRAVVLGARLVEGGTWRERVVFREPLSDATRMRLALGQKLILMPAPAEALRLAVERFGPSAAGAHALFDDGSAVRTGRMREAIRQARAVAGPEAALRVLTVDPDSRVPERQAVLAPYEL